MEWQEPDVRHTAYLIEIVGKLLGYSKVDNGLLEYVAESAEVAHGKLEQAKRAKTKTKQIDQLQDEWERADKKLKLAESAYTALETEVEHINQGLNSELVLVRDSDESKPAKLTKYSVYKWAIQAFGIEIHDWKPPEPETLESPKPQEKFTPTDKKKYEITTAYLMELVVELALKGEKEPLLIESEGPNFTQIATRLKEKMKTRGVTDTGFSAKTIATRLSSCHKAMKEYSDTRK